MSPNRSSISSWTFVERESLESSSYSSSIVPPMMNSSFHDTSPPHVNMPATLQSAPMLPALGEKMQRKRAARACDQCRRRKSRCDGQINCSACSAIGLQCSFGHQVKQSRGPAYIAHLEKKVQALQDQLRRSSCDSEQSNDIDETLTTQTSPKLSNREQSSSETRERQIIPADSRSLCHHSNLRPISVRRADAMASFDDIPEYIETITTEPRGKAFGYDVLRQIVNHTNNMRTSPALPQDSSLRIVQALDSSQTIDDLLASSLSDSLLPTSREKAMRLVEIAFSEAFQLWPFVDKSQIERTVYRLYHTNTFGQDSGDKEELGLVYAILAVGQRFDSSNSVVSAQARRAQGVAYFAAAQELVPLTNCDRSLCAIQTVLCLALILKAASAPGRVHSYTAAAASAALRLGLHEDIPGFPKDESALRRRVWSAVNVFDIYISIALGVPRTVTQESDEQDFYPILSSIGTNTELVASDGHMEMLCILSRGIAKVHHGATARRPVGQGAYSVTQQAVQEASAELEDWAQNCPVMLQPAEHMTRSQLYLVYAFDFAQLLFYSPFVHYITIPGTDSTSQHYLLGLKAIQAAIQAVHIAELLHRQLLFNEAYFLTVDVLVFAATTLLAIELGISSKLDDDDDDDDDDNNNNDQNNNSTLFQEAVQASRVARELLLVLSLHSETAAHCWEALAVHSPQASPTCMQPCLRKSKGPGMLAMPYKPNYKPATLQPTDSAIDLGFSSLQYSPTGGMAYGRAHLLPV